MIKNKSLINNLKVNRGKITGLQRGRESGGHRRRLGGWKREDSSSLILGGQVGGGLGVYQLLFIHELKGNYTYFGDNYDIYTNLVQIIGYACKMKDSSDLLEVGFRWIIMEEGCFILN